MKEQKETGIETRQSSETLSSWMTGHMMKEIGSAVKKEAKEIAKETEKITRIGVQLTEPQTAGILKEITTLKQEI